MKILCVAALLALASANSAYAFVQTKFASEETARQHCPIDMVVWLTLPGNSFGGQRRSALRHDPARRLYVRA